MLAYDAITMLGKRVHGWVYSSLYAAVVCCLLQGPSQTVSDSVSDSLAALLAVSGTMHCSGRLHTPMQAAVKSSMTMQMQGPCSHNSMGKHEAASAGCSPREEAADLCQYS
jgi:hypothetical protein